MLRRKAGSDVFWALARKTARGVAKWPAWKQGRRLHQIFQEEMSAQEEPEPPKPSPKEITGAEFRRRLLNRDREAGYKAFKKRSADLRFGRVPEEEM